jgi:hypothetical protein
MKLQTEAENLLESSNNNQESEPKTEQEKILCPHCKRTATNGIKCQGICVADSDY